MEDALSHIQCFYLYLFSMYIGQISKIFQLWRDLWCHWSSHWVKSGFRNIEIDLYVLQSCLLLVLIFYSDIHYKKNNLTVYRNFNTSWVMKPYQTFGNLVIFIFMFLSDLFYKINCRFILARLHTSLRSKHYYFYGW